MGSRSSVKLCGEQKQRQVVGCSWEEARPLADREGGAAAAGKKCGRWKDGKIEGDHVCSNQALHDVAHAHSMGHG
jgi:hypothetical protein